MAIRNYTTIARVIESVQYDGSQESFDDLIELVGTALTDGRVVVDVDEWVIKLADEEFNVMTDEEFQLTYRPS